MKAFKIYTITMVISALSMTGLYICLAELLKPVMNINVQIILFLVVAALTLPMNYFLKNTYFRMVSEHKRMERKKELDLDFGQTNRSVFDKQVKAIIVISDRLMKTVHFGSPFPVRETVVVPYEDLMKIWSIASELKYTPVEE